ncbi:hypothetical protein ACPA9J_03510 [Pseudomonas aeruginosa]
MEIVADRGIHACCGAERWSAVCQRMEAQFAQGRFEAGALKASWPSATCWCSSTFRGARTTATRVAGSAGPSLNDNILETYHATSISGCHRLP